MSIRQASEKFNTAIPSLIMNEDPRTAGNALAAFVEFVDAILGAQGPLPAGMIEAAERAAAVLPLDDADTTAAALADWFRDMDLYRRGELRELIWELHVLDRRRMS